MRSVACALAALCASSAAAGTTRPNVALGKRYTLVPAPSYPLCTDAGDEVQLTDGVTSSGPDYFWKRASTVGWYDARSVQISVDLGATHDIDALALHTGAGAADVAWPEAIYVFAGESEDRQSYVGDLVTMSGLHVPARYAVARYFAGGVHARGRFVTFVPVVANRRFIFVDEVEVFGTPSGVGTSVARPLAAVSGRPADLTRQLWTQKGARTRVERDVAELRRAISARLPAADVARLGRELDEAAATQNAPPPGRLELPYPGTHERVLRVRAHAMRAAGLPPMLVWQADHWNGPPFVELPPATAVPLRLATSVMRGDDRRSMSLAVTNAGEQPQVVRVAVNGLDPAGPRIELLQSVWTDTLDGVPVAAALAPLARQRNEWTMTVPSGVTRELWMTVRAGHAAAKSYSATLALSADDFARTVPITIEVAPVELVEPTLLVGGFEYANLESAYDLKPTNRDALLRLLDAHRINTAWATHEVLSDAGGGGDVRGAAFARWLERRPHARRYYIYAAVEKGSDDAAQRAAEVSRWAAIVRSHGLRPEAVSLLLVDEPATTAADDRISAWAHALAEAHAGFEVWEDPAGPVLTGRPGLLGAIDVVCQHVESMPASGSRELQALLEWSRRPGHALELYSTRGHAPARDAYREYRLLPWSAFTLGARAIHFWSMIDAGGASSWRPYEATRDHFAPIFIDASSATTTRQLEALTEGVEDHAYLDMVRRWAKADGAASRALALLASAVAVTSSDRRDAAELLRLQILAALSSRRAAR